jgi:hypothetical protein
MSSFDPENSVRANDYNRYRKQLDFQRFLVQYRYTFIRGVKQVRQGKSDHEILEMLQAISPDSNRNTKIMESLKSENKQPWP